MKYPYRVFQTMVEDHVFWVAECSALKGCVGQGDTLEEALKELEDNELEWLRLAAEYELEIPEIPVVPMSAYSGKLTLRVAPYVHQEAAENAKKQNISLNQYINDALVAQNARVSTIGYIASEVKKAAMDIVGLMYSPAEYAMGMTSTTLTDSYTVSSGNGMSAYSAAQISLNPTHPQ